MALLPPEFSIQFLTDTGVIAAGYKLHTYVTGTTTNKNTYTDQAAGSTNTHPITLDSAGRCLLWLWTGEYTFVLKDPADTTTVWTRDNVAGVPAAVTGAYLLLAGGTMTGLITLSGNATSNLNPVPLQQVTTLIAAAAATQTTAISTAIPIGTIALWASGAPPTNWLHLNGQAISRTTYATLFALWGTTYGTGNGSTTFNVMEVRGEFPRFSDESRGIDSGRVIGTAQAQAIQAHTHTYRGETITAGGADPSGTGGTFASGNSGSTGGTETRPRNVSFMGIVRAL